MENKALTESGRKAIAGKNKIKDNGLQRALADYESTDEEDHAERLKGIARVNQLAAALQRSKDIAGNDAVTDYLDDVQDAADAEQRELAKAKQTAAKAEAEAKKQEKEEDAYEAKLMAALQKLKSSSGLSYEFLVCDGPEQCAVVVAPSISAQHRAQLTRLTEGGKRFFGPGACRFEDGKYLFAMDRPPSALAKKLQASIMHFTGRKLPLKIGAETADADADA